MTPSKNARLIVGLGNPGPEYEETRHNIGFRIVDVLAEQAGIAYRQDGRAGALVGWGKVRGRPVGLAKPVTYMNRSGAAVDELARRHGLRPEDLLVVFDDINLPAGTIRLRAGGSAGGHNGVQDLIDALGTDAFPRLRVGIGNAFARGRQADYVLAPFTEEERPLVAEAVARARDAAITFVTDGLTTAMNRFNR
jgi:PTH1 family peptidyl-tRNA hydrolase